MSQTQFASERYKATQRQQWMASAKECVTFERESLGAFNQMMFHLSPEERAAVWDEVEAAMRNFEGPNGVELSCEPLFGIAKKG